jgi:hypothetical protein
MILDSILSVLADGTATGKHSGLGPYLSTESLYRGDIVLTLMSIMADDEFVSFYSSYIIGLVIVPFYTYYLVHYVIR